MRPACRILSIVLLAGAVDGCRGLPRGLWSRPPLPESHQVPVQQLVFHSDFDLPSRHRLVRELTAERDDVAEVLALPPSDEPIHVYLFRDADAYAMYLARQFPSAPSRRAFFVETDTRLAVYAHWSDRVAEDLRHEVAHGYLHASVPAIPLWLDEGLAEYFEVPRAQGGLHRAHLDLLTDLMEHNGWRPNLERLEQLRAAGDMQQADYAESWGWVYFMLHAEAGHRPVLTRYLADLRDRGRIEPLSQRLADEHLEPERTLTEYLSSLQAELAAAR